MAQTHDWAVGLTPACPECGEQLDTRLTCHDCEMTFILEECDFMIEVA